MFTLLTAIFYLFTFYVIYREGQMLFHPRKVTAAYRETEDRLFSIETNGTSEEVAKDTMKKTSKTDREMVIFHFTYMIWTFVGLLTFNWPFFAGIIMLSLLYKKKDNALFNFFDALITIILLVAILVNKYMVHYNFTIAIREYVMSFFS